MEGASSKMNGCAHLLNSVRTPEEACFPVPLAGAMLAILLLYFCFPYTLHARVSHSFEKLSLPSMGSEAYAFNSRGKGPYTCLGDGRITMYQGPEIGFVGFATTSANWSMELCDDQVRDTNPQRGAICGRPVALEFNHKTGDLYIIDAFHGLMVVGPEGGLATQLSGGIDGVPIDVPDALDVDPVTGAVFYTDVGSIFLQQPINLTRILSSKDASGRLLKYDPRTKQRTVVLTGLSGPNGVAVGKDGTFVLVSEFIGARIRKYWIKGPNANTSEVLLNLTGSPDNIKRTKRGDFWVPVNVLRLLPRETNFPLAQRFNAEGQILETLNFYAEYNETYITEVHEHLGSFYVASIFTDFVGIYKFCSCRCIQGDLGPELIVYLPSMSKEVLVNH